MFLARRYNDSEPLYEITFEDESFPALFQEENTYLGEETNIRFSIRTPVEPKPREKERYETSSKTVSQDGCQHVMAVGDAVGEEGDEDIDSWYRRYHFANLFYSQQTTFFTS